MGEWQKNSTLLHNNLGQFRLSVWISAKSELAELTHNSQPSDGRVGLTKATLATYENWRILSILSVNSCILQLNNNKVYMASLWLKHNSYPYRHTITLFFTPKRPHFGSFFTTSFWLAAHWALTWPLLYHYITGESFHSQQSTLSMDIL